MLVPPVMTTVLSGSVLINVILPVVVLPLSPLPAVTELTLPPEKLDIGYS